MKKILFLFAAAFAMLLTACNGCKPEPPVNPDEDALVIKTDVLEEIIPQVRVYVAKNYPAFEFYELSFVVKTLPENKIGVDHNSVQFAFGNPFKMECLVGAILNDTVKIVKYEEPWLEDRYMTPYVPMDLDYAFKLLQEKIDIAPEGVLGVLRFQLFPKISSPQYLFGTIADCHSVNIYTGVVDELDDAGKVANVKAGLKSELEKAAK